MLSTHTGDQEAMLTELSQERVIYDTLVKMESKKRPNKVWLLTLTFVDQNSA